MVGSSFINERYESHFVDLDYVNRYLQWNPHPRDRALTQRFLWDVMDTTPESVQQCRREISAEAFETTNESLTVFEKRKALEDAQLRDVKQCVGHWARRLAEYHEGRVLLDAEDPGEYATDSKYWFARAACYRAEYEKLEKEVYHRASGSVTPGIACPDMPWYTEVARAKCEAGNVARLLADFPAGKALLEAEDHGSSIKDGNYWWTLENFQKPPLEVEGYGDSITDPEYWWNKKRFYNAQLKAEMETTILQRAKQSADSRARDLATFPAGKTLLEAEDHRDSAMDPGYWRSKKRYYKAEYDKLEQEHWDRWKHKNLDGREFPFDALNDSKPKTRARRSSATKERRTTRGIRDTTQQREDTDQLQLGAIASNPNRYAGAKTRDGRRKGKDRYRRRNAQLAERKPSSPPLDSSATQDSLNGCLTPNSDRPRTCQPWIRSRSENAAQRRHKVTDPSPDGRPGKSQPQATSQSRNPYVTPNSTNFSEPKAQQRRKYKGAVRQKRRLNADSAYHGSRAVSQPQEPVSSRLRNGGRSRGGRSLRG